MATALIPLNRFINIAARVTSAGQIIYTTPPNVSSIVLSANCTNISTSEVFVTAAIRKLVGTTEIDYYLVPGMPIPPNDVFSIISGRLVLTQFDKLIMSASADNSVDFIMSLNEAANE